jgi:RHS repeat-associated protein
LAPHHNGSSGKQQIQFAKEIAAKRTTKRRLLKISSEVASPADLHFCGFAEVREVFDPPIRIGRCFLYTYDAGNRITQVDEKDATNTVTATITRTYDGLDRLTNETTPQGSVTYVYDNASRRTSMTVTGQPAVTYIYDNANRLTTITQGTDTVTIAYDDADRRTSVTYPNGNSVIYGYNVASDLTSITYKQGATTLGDLTYTYDAAGNRIKTGGTFARSNIPPALTTTNYNANNQQLTFGTTTETYDLNGNLATTTDTGVTTTYTWNARNQLTAISGPSLTASFTYDSFGRRTGKTVNGTTTNFLYDGLNPVQEKNGATVTANLLTGLGIDEFFTRTNSVGVRSLLPDAPGSTVALGDGTGTLQTQYTYEPFGFVSQTGSASTNSYKYTGREDDGSGLFYYRARYYQPRFQRFISEDPLRFSGEDANLYEYVSGNPMMYRDPYGLFELPLLPREVVDASAGIGDALSLGLTDLIRDALDINTVVDKCSDAYKGGKYAGHALGGSGLALRGAAALGGTRLGSFLNSNRYLRTGPGRMPANGPLPASTNAPRISIGQGPGNPHIDLRVRGID